MILYKIYSYTIVVHMVEKFICYIFTTEGWSEERIISYRVETYTSNAQNYNKLVLRKKIRKYVFKLALSWFFYLPF
jgi:hypothetical protein